MSLTAKHKIFETNVLVLLIGILLTVICGGLVEIVPLFTIKSTIEPVKGVRPYSPLELAGRNIYLREGCYLCHSQMIRPFKDEVERYGHYSLAAESIYDHPFQWGSKRNGPDLARIGGKYTNDWHVRHLINPRDVVPESIMPSYSFMAKTPLAYDDIAEHLKTLRIVGVPYTDEQIKNAKADLEAQGTNDADVSGVMNRYPKARVGRANNGEKITELDALIAYLQVLGTMVDFTSFNPELVNR